MQLPKIKISLNTEPKNDIEKWFVLGAGGVLVILLVTVVMLGLTIGGDGFGMAKSAEEVLSEISEDSPVRENVMEKTGFDDMAVVKRLTDELKNETLEKVMAGYGNLGLVKCDSYINFRKAPDQNDLTNIQGMIRNGAAVDILDSNDGWSHVRSGGMEGYVSSRFLVTGDEARSWAPELIDARVTILSDKLRMRITPEIVDGNTVGSCAEGEKYKVLGRFSQDWVIISADNMDNVDSAFISTADNSVSIDYGFDEARTLDLKQKVLNSYDNLGVSLAKDYINIRSSPEEDGIKNIVGKLPGFAGCSIRGEENGWYRIVSGGVEGYVRADLLATGEDAQNLAFQNAHVMAIVNTPSLNVRSAPSTESKAWTQITSGQRYDVVNQMDGWVELDLGAGDDDGADQGSFVSTRDNNVKVMFALQEAIEYYPALEAANAAAAFRNKIVNFACQYVGNRYVWGGTSLTNGCDCSGFTQSVLKNFGISIPRVSRDQAHAGERVTSDKMKPGDLVFYANNSGTINHVGMYIGNGQIVNAASAKAGIRIYRWNYRTPVAIRNVIGE